MTSPQNVGLYPQDESLDQEEFGEAEEKFVSLFRRIATPFRRVNKRLKVMESVQDKMDSVVSDLKTVVLTSTTELLSEMKDFRNHWREQVTEINNWKGEVNQGLAVQQQCCEGNSKETARFRAQVAPVVDKLDHWMSTWENEATVKFKQLYQQGSYNQEILLKSNKELERLLLEGLDMCNTRGRTVERTTGVISTTTTTTLAPVTEKLKQVFVTKEDSDFQKEQEAASTWCATVKDNPGVYEIDGVSLYCDPITAGGGWTVIQRRGNFGTPRENFTRSWDEYKKGFGSMEEEFWAGNALISQITSGPQPYILRVELEAHNGTSTFAQYAHFSVDGEQDDFRMWVSGYSGNASDSLSAHNGYKFSTVDRTNDEAPKCCPCAPAYGGGWWFYSCFESNLNGEYFTDPVDNGYYRGIIWELWLGDYSLQSARMMVRPRDFQTRGEGIIPPDP